MNESHHSLPTDFTPSYSALDLWVADVETTGLDPETDTVCQVAYRQFGDGGTAYSTLVDPGQPIPPTASAVHHITDKCIREGLEDGLCEETMREALFHLRAGVIIAAHNSRFDAPFIEPHLSAPVTWIDTYRCALAIWPDAPGHSNQVLRYWLNLPEPPRLYSMPHDAAHDVWVTHAILCHLLRDHTIAELVAISSRPALLPTVDFGKHHGERWADVPEGYLKWVTGQDFDEDVIHTANHWLEFPEKEEIA